MFIDCSKPENRTGRLLSRQELELLQDNDEDVFAVNNIDRYSARPDELEQLTLVEFRQDSRRLVNHPDSKRVVRLQHLMKWSPPVTPTKITPVKRNSNR